MMKKVIRAIGVILMIIGVANFDPSGWRGIDTAFEKEPLVPILLIVVGIFMAFYEEIFMVFSRKK